MKVPHPQLKPRLVAGVAIAVAAIGAGSGVAAAFAGPNERPSHGTPDKIAKIRTNESGQTYGSALGAMSDADLPDLILVVSDSGQIGYIRKRDLLAEPVPKSPEEALRMQAAQKDNPPRFPVYSSDGTTRIGVLTVNTHGRRGNLPKGDR